MEYRDIASYRRVFSKIRRKIHLLGQDWAPTNAVVDFKYVVHL